MDSGHDLRSSPIFKEENPLQTRSFGIFNAYLQTPKSNYDSESYPVQKIVKNYIRLLTLESVSTPFRNSHDFDSRESQKAHNLSFGPKNLQNLSLTSKGEISLKSPNRSPNKIAQNLSPSNQHSSMNTKNKINKNPFQKNPSNFFVSKNPNYKLPKYQNTKNLNLQEELASNFLPLNPEKHQFPQIPQYHITNPFLGGHFQAGSNNSIKNTDLFNLELLKCLHSMMWLSTQSIKIRLFRMINNFLMNSDRVKSIDLKNLQPLFQESLKELSSKTSKIKTVGSGGLFSSTDNISSPISFNQRQRSPRSREASIHFQIHRFLGLFIGRGIITCRTQVADSYIDLLYQSLNGQEPSQNAAEGSSLSRILQTL